MRRCLWLTIAGAVGVTGRILWRRCVEQLTRSRDVLGAPAVGEETVVADAVETVGQDVDQEAADELVGVERHELVASVALGPVILPFESDALAVEGDEPAVGNGDPVSVARQVGEHCVRSAKRPLGIDHPFELAQCGKPGFEGCRLGEGGLVGEKLQPPSLVGGGQPFEEQATEEARKHPDGEKEAGPAGNPMLSVRREAAARYDDMSVRMVAPTPIIP